MGLFVRTAIVCLVLCFSLAQASYYLLGNQLCSRPCLSRMCPSTVGCSYGTMMDQCGCCSVCIRHRGQLCGGSRYRCGMCGTGLSCYSSASSILYNTRGVCMPTMNYAARIGTLGGCPPVSMCRMRLSSCSSACMSGYGIGGLGMGYGMGGVGMGYGYGGLGMGYGMGGVGYGYGMGGVGMGYGGYGYGYQG